MPISQTTDLLVVSIKTFTQSDWEYLDGLNDLDRASEAYAMAYNRDEEVKGTDVLVANETEIVQMVETLEAVIAYMLNNAADTNVGFAEQLGDIRDFLTTRNLSTESSVK
jgi:hypothetical protein